MAQMPFEVCPRPLFDFGFETIAPLGDWTFILTVAR